MFVLLVWQGGEGDDFGLIPKAQAVLPHHTRCEWYDMGGDSFICRMPARDEGAFRLVRCLGRFSVIQ